MQGTLTPEYSTSTTDLIPEISSPGPNISNISVQLPGEVFANVTDNSVGLLYSLYLTGSLFPVAPDSQEEGFFIASPVVGAAVSGKNIVNLHSPVIITLPITSVQVIDTPADTMAFFFARNPVQIPSPATLHVFVHKVIL